MPIGFQGLSWDAPFYLKPRPAEAGPGKGEWAYENNRPIWQESPIQREDFPCKKLARRGKR
nr:MAG TPA: hypothetical protein [Caudoviricetes sp.]